MPKLFRAMRGRDALAWIKHRRWWAWNVNPAGPSFVRITEDAAFRRVTEDGLYLRITEG